MSELTDKQKTRIYQFISFLVLLPIVVGLTWALGYFLAPPAGRLQVAAAKGDVEEVRRLRDQSGNTKPAEPKTRAALAAIAASGSGGTEEKPQATKGILDGLFAGTFGLVALLFQTAATFFKPGHEAVISAQVDQLWNAGGGDYKFGFITGVLLLLILAGGSGSAAASAKKWTRGGDKKNTDGGTS